MGRRHWYNDWARNTRDLRYLQRVYGAKTPEEAEAMRRQFVKLVWIVGGFVVLLIFVLFLMVMSGHDARKKLTPEMVTQTVEAVVRGRLDPVGATYVPTKPVRAAAAGTPGPTETPIPTPTIDQALLIRYEETRTDSQGRQYVQCLIKGNINSKGSKIYHVPGSSSYNSTKIDTSQGERWFCTEFDAIAAGWHAPGQ